MSSKNGTAIFVLAVAGCFSSAVTLGKKKFRDYGISNEVIVEEKIEEISTPMRYGRIMEYILEKNTIPEDPQIYLLPSQIIEKTKRILKSNRYDPYHLDDVELLIPSEGVKSARFNNVLLDNGHLFGMSDFRTVDDPKLPKDPLQLWFIWNHLYVTYRVTVNDDGLKSVGELDSRVEGLLMHVEMPGSDSGEPKIEMSKIRELETKVLNLDMLSSDFRIALRMETEKRIKNFLNNKVRNILLNFIKISVSKNSTGNELSPFSASVQYYVEY